MFITVTEKWDRAHTAEEGTLVDKKHQEMVADGKLTKDPATNMYSHFGADGSPTKIFTSQEAADESIAFISNLSPTATVVKSFETEDELKAFLDSLGKADLPPPAEVPFVPTIPLDAPPGTVAQ